MIVTETQAATPPAREILQGPAMRRLLGEIALALKDLQFGDVTVLIRDGGVVRIERNEKTRLFRGKP